jgi:predicted Zn-dependent protease
LISAAGNEEELSGVICHELAHIELKHVMKKLIKEVGLSVLISMTTGNSGTEKVKETAKMLSSTAFDRSLEKEADLKAVEYLIKTNIDPEPFANFLYKLSDRESDVMKYLSWVSTHPDSKERAEYIIESFKGKETKTEHVLSQETWERVKDKLKE